MNRSTTSYLAMDPYTYTSLNTDRNEIRLVKLFPGLFDDVITFDIFHVPLPIPTSEPTTQRLSIVDLRKTMPTDWDILETLDGRYLFAQDGEDVEPSSWIHPNSNIDASLYTEEVETMKEHGLKFEALSYTWGSMDSPVAASIRSSPSSQDRGPYLELGANLAVALKYLRHPHAVRLLWIDAVCINQGDIEERNAQVKRMGDIFSLAQTVTVWLGVESHDSTHALMTLQYFGEQVEDIVHGYIGDSPGATERRWWIPAYPLPYDEKTWMSIISLFRRPWFSRVWVLQEVQLAGRRAVVQCGHDKIPWSAVRKAFTVLSQKAELDQTLRALLRAYRNGVLRRIDTAFMRLLTWSREHQCSDPRDKVYGVLSLSPTSVQEMIYPQYEKPTLQVYLDSFLANLHATRRLDFLLARRHWAQVRESSVCW